MSKHFRPAVVRGATALTGLAICLASGPAVAAWSEKTLYNFGANGAGDGAIPFAGLTRNANGKLYGVTQSGGAFNTGAVFELSPPAKKGGAWIEKVLYSFGASATDANTPLAAMVMDATGHLYGAAHGGGAYDHGAVFELSPPATANGKWKERLLHSFGAFGGDGAYPLARLSLDAKGNLYGTTLYGGGAGTCVYGGCGAVFELHAPATAGGTWRETLLHSFTTSGGDGYGPYAGVVFDAKGDLFGVTQAGGKFANGAAFELSPPATSGGAWREAVIYSFGARASDGTWPEANLVMDSKGDLYGTTITGGSGECLAPSCGVVFELTPPASAGGSWKETVLYNFGARAYDAYDPLGLMIDAKDNLYGVTRLGGVANQGTVFELRAPRTYGAAWTESVLYSFTGAYECWPEGSPVMDAFGDLYGTIPCGAGNVFQLTP